jgi:hypothetical protein
MHNDAGGEAGVRVREGSGEKIVQALGSVDVQGTVAGVEDGGEGAG